MALIEPIRTTLPFYTSKDERYYERAQCTMECFYGTITDRNHLPPFIVQRTESLYLDFELTIKCLDETDSQVLTPATVISFVAFATAADVPVIEAQPGNMIGDAYLISDTLSQLPTGEWQITRRVWNGVSLVPDLVILQDLGLYEETSSDIYWLWDDSNGVFVKTYNGFQVCTIDGVDYIVYNGFAFNENINCGRKYATLSDGGAEYYSDVIDVRNFSPTDNDLFKIRLEQSCDLGNIPYSSLVGFEQYLWLTNETIVGEPEYSYEEEVEEDGHGREEVIFQKIGTIHLFDSGEQPEYILSWLQFAPLHNRVLIKDKTLPEKCIDKYTVTNQWLQTGCYGNMTVKFRYEDDIISNSCCDTIEKDECFTADIIGDSYQDKGSRPGLEIPENEGKSYIITDIGADAEWDGHEWEVARWNGSSWDYTVPTDYLRVSIESPINSPLQMYYNSIWGDIVRLNSCVNSGPTGATISGVAPEDTNIQIYWRRTGTFTWMKGDLITQAQLLTGYLQPLVNCSTYDIRIESFTPNCNYGTAECTVGISDATC